MGALKTITAFPLSAYCGTTGTSSGTVNANGNYSAAPQTFYAQPAADQDYIIQAVSIHFTATFTGSKLVYNEYCTIAGGLTNGITVQTYDTINATVIHDLTQGQPLKFNDDFLHLGTGLEVYEFANNVLSINATLDLSPLGKINSPLTLKGANSEQIQFILNDDFSTITDHHLLIKGYINDSGGYR